MPSETLPSDVPVGQATASSNTFELIAPEQRKLDLRQTDGRAEVTYMLENKKFHPVRGRLEIEPLGATQAEWLTVAGERNRDFRNREALDFRVLIAIPPNTPANTFEFTAIGINEANPEEDFTDQDGASISIDWEPAPLVKRISKWKLALMVLAPLLVLGVGGVLLYRYWYPPEPLDVLEQANSYADAGEWDNYWKCWTKQGQHKLLYWVAAAIKEDIQGEQSEKKDRWDRQLSVWLQSFGLILKDVQDLQDLNSKPPDISPWEQGQTLRLKIERHGRTSKDFFVTAAAWREPDQQDFPDEQKRKVELLKTRRELMFLPFCREDFKKIKGDEMALYLAVSWPDGEEGDKAKFPKRCYLCRELEDKAESEVPDDAIKTFKKYKEKTNQLTVSFRKVDGVWLLNDFWKENE